MYVLSKNSKIITVVFYVYIFQSYVLTRDLDKGGFTIRFFLKLLFNQIIHYMPPCKALQNLVIPKYLYNTVMNFTVMLYIYFYYL